MIQLFWFSTNVMFVFSLTSWYHIQAIQAIHAESPEAIPLSNFLGI